MKDLIVPEWNRNAKTDGQAGLQRWNVQRVVVPILAWSWFVMALVGWQEGGTCWTVFLVGLGIETAGYVLRRKRILAIADRGHEICQSLTAMSDYAQVLMCAGGESELLLELQNVTRRPPRPMPRTLCTAIGLVAQLPVAYYLAVQLVPLLESRLLCRLRGLSDFWNAIGCYEVLAAFAAYAYEHPSDTIPSELFLLVYGLSDLMDRNAGMSCTCFC